MTKRRLFIFGFFVIAIVGIVFITQIGITPADVKIIEILKNNRENLLRVVGVVGAGIARDEKNHIIGIAVYVEDNIINSQEIPSELDEFNVFVKDVSEATESEKESMIIRNTHYHLLNVTTDKTMYQQNNNITITIKNESNETFIFGNSVYDLFFKKWNGDSWEVYTGIIGLEVITYLNPEETAASYLSG